MVEITQDAIEQRKFEHEVQKKIVKENDKDYDAFAPN